MGRESERPFTEEETQTAYKLWKVLNLISNQLKMKIKTTRRHFTPAKLAQLHNNIFEDVEPQAFNML